MDKYPDPRQCWEAFKDRAQRSARFVIAIDGPDCSGKSTLAQGIAALASAQGRTCGIIHVDDQIVQPATRPRKNPDAVSEFIIDYFNYDGLKNQISGTDGIVIIEGLFLLRAWFLEQYDFTIRLELSEEQVFFRAARRDRESYASWGDFALHYVSQSIASQRVYRELCAPDETADLVIRLD